MVLHNFQGHKTERLQLQWEKCNLVIIPIDMTRMLQPLNIIINWPFKAQIWCSYSKLMQKTNETLPTVALKWPGWQKCGDEFSKPDTLFYKTWQQKALKLLASLTRQTGGGKNDILWYRPDKESCQPDTTDSELTYFDQKQYIFISLPCFYSSNYFHVYTINFTERVLPINNSRTSILNKFLFLIFSIFLEHLTVSTGGFTTNTWVMVSVVYRIMAFLVSFS